MVKKKRGTFEEKKKNPARLYPDDSVKARWSIRTIFSSALMSRLGHRGLKGNQIQDLGGDKFSTGT